MKASAWIALLSMLTQVSSQETVGSCSSSQPGCDENVAMIQLKDDKVGRSGTCDFNDLNQQGDCTADESCQCTPNPSGQEIGPFSLGYLRCSGEKSCSTEDDGKYYNFKDSSQYLACSGKESCRYPFNVHNVGAACCTGYKACGKETTLFLNSDGQSSCTNDVCCAAKEACKEAVLEGVHSLSCAGSEDYICNKVSATLSGDLFCQSKKGCQEGTFRVSGSDHCVTCSAVPGSDDYGSCMDSVFNFDGSADVRMNCVGKKSCQKAQVHLASGTCLDLICDGEYACKEMEITLNGGGCKCSGSNCPADICPAQSECSIANPSTICAAGNADTACCATGGTPDCAQCCNTGGGAAGDPHIQSLHGAHYTLLKTGTFKAWSFSKDTRFPSKMGLQGANVQWQMFARYSGQQFNTRGLLLLDQTRDSVKSMELTSKDCVWRAKNGGDGEWRDVKKRELLSLSEDHISSFDVTEPHKLQKGATGQPWTISYMSLKMNKGHGDGLVARLYTQCIPGDHLDYKVIMFDKKDIDIVGGELGVSADSAQKEINPITGQSHLLSSRLRSMHMRADSEFQVEKSWVDLGGTKAGSSYLEQEPEPSLVMTDCTPSDEEKAATMCAEYLPKEAKTESEVFADCVYDVCHGAGEESAALAAALIKA